MNDPQLTGQWDSLDGVPTTKTEIMEFWWIEFLQFVKNWNSKVKRMADITEFSEALAYEKDASEINFWHWYIDTKMEDK